MYSQSPPEYKIGSCFLLCNFISDRSFRFNIIISNFYNEEALTVVLKPYDIINCKDEACILKEDDHSFLKSDQYVDFKLSYSMKLPVLVNLSVQQESIQEKFKIFYNKGYITDNCLDRIQEAAIKNKSKIKHIYHILMDHF